MNQKKGEKLTNKKRRMYFEIWIDFYTLTFAKKKLNFTLLLWKDVKRHHSIVTIMCHSNELSSMMS